MKNGRRQTKTESLHKSPNKHYKNRKTVGETLTDNDSIHHDQQTHLTMLYIYNIDPHPDITGIHKSLLDPGECLPARRHLPNNIIVFGFNYHKPS